MGFGFWDIWSGLCALVAVDEILPRKFPACYLSESERSLQYPHCDLVADANKSDS